MERIDSGISQRIALLRYLMIFGIVVLHTPPYVPLAETGTGVFDLIKAFFQHAVFRASVPVLTFISGYLLFHERLDLQVRALATKKTKTILLPFILFNIPLAIAVYLVQANELVDHDFSAQLHPFNLAIWADAIVGLFGSPINYPLHFLRDLYILSLCAPVFSLPLRRLPWHGLVVVFFVFWFNYDGYFISQNTMPIVFYLGGMAAVLGWNLRTLDSFAGVLFALFLALCIATVIFQIENRNYLRLVSPILIWPAASLLVGTKFGAWIARLSKYSFITFLAHAPLLLAAALVYTTALPTVPYWAFGVLAPVIIAAVLVQIQIYLQRYFPKPASILLGGRHLEKSSHVLTPSSNGVGRV